MRSTVCHSPDDAAFRDDFEAGRIGTAGFRHRDHLRLAFVYLCESNVDSAHRRMRASIERFLALHGIDAGKYHETLTLAWVQAVRHFIEQCPHADSFAAFSAHDPRLLDAAIMDTHYSRDRLFAPSSRTRFAKPDRAPIPQHE